MSFTESSLRVQRGLLAAILLGSAVAIWPSVVEPFMLPKVTAVVVGAEVLLALGAARVVWLRRLSVPVSSVSMAVAALALALVVATVSSSSPWTSLIGVPGRYTGLAPYLAYLAVFLVALRVTDLSLVRLLSRTALVALGLSAGYGLLQAAGIDPAGLPDIGLGTTYSFFGNTNFGAAWVGAVSALALMVTLSTSEHRAWRIYAGVLLPASLAYVVFTGTSQGPLVYLVAVGFTGVVLALTPDGAVRRAAQGRRTLVLAMAGGAALVVVIGLVVGSSFLRTQLDQALVERPEFWAASLSIFADNPLVGTGLDTYRDNFMAYRPESHALAQGYGTADAPHSVPLGMLSNGGLLLGLTYAAAVVAVGVALVRGLLTARGDQRLALAGFGGVWLAYQAQSLISFDVPPLAMLHWLSAGVIVALAAPPAWRTVSLPGKAVAQPVNRKGKPVGQAVVPASTWAGQAGVAVVGLVAVFFALYPLRADLLAASEPNVSNPEQAARALANFERAAEMNPADPGYPYLAAQTFMAGEQYVESLVAGAEAADRNRGSVQYAFFVARQAQLLQDGATAAVWIREAARRDPSNPLTLVQSGGYLQSVGQTEDARELLTRALELDPDNAEAQSLLGAG